ncbi:MAG: hypothetical protein SFU56_12590 [Capsulimonadales bacterium]|nr:hypothetical protein [Capsulimonadales bacterium]
MILYDPNGNAHAPFSSHHWQAWRFHEPGGGFVLKVIGFCVVDSPGYSGYLRAVPEQSYNRNLLLLEKVIIPPAGTVLPSPSPHTLEIRYEDRSDGHHTHVQIVSDFVTLPIRDVYPA